MRFECVVLFLFYTNAFCHYWLVDVSSFSTSKITRSWTYLRSTNDVDPSVSPVALGLNDTSRIIGKENPAESKSELACRVLGFYPFPTSPPRGPLGWILKDTHQAIIVTETLSRRAEATELGKAREKKSVRIDFMTKNGANHPVWFNEVVKWNVLLGGCIEGEVRVTTLGTKSQRQTTNMNEKAKGGRVFPIDDTESTAGGLKLKRLIDYANDYDCRMNLYRNNCRIFVARMEREVIRLNLEGTDNQDTRRLLAIADIRCALRIAWAAFLPAIYPMGAIFLVYEGCFMAN